MFCGLHDDGSFTVNQLESELAANQTQKTVFKRFIENDVENADEAVVRNSPWVTGLEPMRRDSSLLEKLVPIMILLRNGGCRSYYRVSLVFSVFLH